MPPLLPCDGEVDGVLPDPPAPPVPPLLLFEPPPPEPPLPPFLVYAFAPKPPPAEVILENTELPPAVASDDEF